MPDRPNLLMIAVDDLRPELACYGVEQMHTPNIDRLAQRGVQFDRAYCQVPVCGASRASLFSGIRPTPQRFKGYATWGEQDAPNVTPLHKYLLNAGYTTASYGKVLHHGRDWAEGWTHLVPRPGHSLPGYRNAANVTLFERQLEAAGGNRGNVKPRGPAWEVGENCDEAYEDHVMLEKVIAQLDRLAKEDKPFMLGAGFVRPHLPFLAPEKYWDLYSPAEFEVPPMVPPTDCPSQALHTSSELRGNYTGASGELPFDDATARTLIHGYRASVSFLDAMIGKLLDALDASPAADNTIIMLCVDHGWNLGEHGLWCKHCLFETSLRVPLLIAGPAITPGRTDRIADNLDIYPTVCDLLGLPQPDHLEGESLTPLLGVGADKSQRQKTTSLSRYNSGESIRTDRYRYSQYRSEGQMVSHMLYDHEQDPGETVNLANQPEHAAVVEQLAALLPPA